MDHNALKEIRKKLNLMRLCSSWIWAFNLYHAFRNLHLTETFFLTLMISGELLLFCIYCSVLLSVRCKASCHTHIVLDLSCDSWCCSWSLSDTSSRTLSRRYSHAFADWKHSQTPTWVLLSVYQWSHWGPENIIQELRNAKDTMVSGI